MRVVGFRVLGFWGLGFRGFGFSGLGCRVQGTIYVVLWDKCCFPFLVFMGTYSKANPGGLKFPGNEFPSSVFLIRS